MIWSASLPRDKETAPQEICNPSTGEAETGDHNTSSMPASREQVKDSLGYVTISSSKESRGLYSICLHFCLLISITLQSLQVLVQDVAMNKNLDTG